MVFNRVTCALLVEMFYTTKAGGRLADVDRGTSGPFLQPYRKRCDLMIILVTGGSGFIDAGFVSGCVENNYSGQMA